MRFLHHSIVIGVFVAAAVASADVTVLYGGNRQGAFEPCGCPVKQLGGLGRWATAVKNRRDASAVLVDGGNALLPVSARTPEERRQVARLVADAYRAAKVAGIAPAPADLGEGLAFLETLDLPWVSANLRRADGTTPFPAHRLVTVGGESVALIGLTAHATGSDYRVDEPKPALVKAVTAAREAKASRVVVLSSLGIEATAALLEGAKTPTVIVASTALESPDKPRRLDGGLVGVETEPEGKHLGVVRFSGEGELVELDQNVRGDAVVEKQIAVYRNERKVAALATPAPTSSEKSAYVAQAHRCQQCHQEQYEFWKKTHHASAYLVLFSKNTHLDPECVVCHSLAFEKPGGFDRVGLAIEPKPGKEGTSKLPFVEQILKATFAKEKKPVKALDSREDPKRYAVLKERYHTELERWQKQGKLERVWAGVQCENCHGSRVGHPENGAPAFGKVPESTCKQCHKDPHHPGFDFAALKPKVSCPPLKRGS